MKKKIIKDFPNYEIYEDRRIRNIKTGRFLVVRGTIFLQNRTGQHICSVRKLMQQAGFYNPPKIKGVKHMVVNNFPNYQLYENGQVWDRIRGMWKKLSTGKRGHKSVSLTNSQGRKDFLVHVLMYKQFKGDIPKGWVCHHRDGHPDHNVLDNLQIMTRKEHTAIHKKGNKYNLGRHHTPQTKERIRQKNLGKVDSAQTRKKKSQAQKRRWAKIKQERGD